MKYLFLILFMLAGYYIKAQPVEIPEMLVDSVYNDTTLQWSYDTAFLLKIENSVPGSYQLEVDTLTRSQVINRLVSNAESQFKFADEIYINSYVKEQEALKFVTAIDNFFGTGTYREVLADKYANYLVSNTWKIMPNDITLTASLTPANYVQFKNVNDIVILTAEIRSLMGFSALINSTGEVIKFVKLQNNNFAAKLADDSIIRLIKQ